jgi:hypothetical protein
MYPHLLPSSSSELNVVWYLYFSFLPLTKKMRRKIKSERNILVEAAAERRNRRTNIARYVLAVLLLYIP